MPEVTPYDGTKPMYLVEDVDDKEKLVEIVKATIEGLKQS
ncbi:transcriptional regulator [Candidatus Saccharibacteria bacterium]|nr:transcriptional regulator [Candidatus Saccharibacteria bacterium]